ncbi:hypothetical protein [Aquimarina agarivorans]|uniref:hypothetical protein n=1 Tax=Aquimarina agarivorans TaxID=980584 RepID=UPI00049631E2|nr:hypothetical protein [Aquimarina agarivorans]
MNWHLTNIPTETGSISFDYRLNQYFLVDNLMGFMLGNNSGAEVHNSVIEDRPYYKKNYQTTLFKTEDGGLSFKKITVGKGTLSKMTKDTQGNLYVIKEVYEKDNTPPQYTILKSTDVGETWQEIGGFNTQKIFNVRFYDANKGIVSIEKGKGVELLKTIDGGKTWETLIVKVKGVDINDPFFINENELYTTYEAEDTNATATVNFNTGKTIVHQCNLPKGYRFDVFFNDDVTGNLYSEVLKYGELHPLMLYNHTTQKLITYDFKNNRDQTNVGVNISGNYIAVLRSDNGKIFYYYSKDNGKNWIKESLPDYLADSHPIALYGKGLVWVKSIRNLYNLQVRKPSFQN